MQLNPNVTYADYGEGLEPVFVRKINGISTVLRCRDEARKLRAFLDDNRRALDADPEYKDSAEKMHLHALCGKS